MTHEFKHPKYYKELRDAGTELAKRNAVKQHLDLYPGSSPVRNKSDQVISNAEATAASERAPGPGHMLPDSKMVKQRASSSTSRGQEQQASGSKLVKHQAASIKPQA